MRKALTEFFFKIVSGVIAFTLVFGALGSFIYFDRHPKGFPRHALPLVIAIGGTLIAVLAISGKTSAERAEMKRLDWLRVASIAVLSWMAAGAIKTGYFH